MIRIRLNSIKKTAVLREIGPDRRDLFKSAN